MDIYEKIKNCKTMPELDDLRLEVCTCMSANRGVEFKQIQKAFIKKKNKLKRIPLKDRNW
jgi:hypothetical protein